MERSQSPLFSPSRFVARVRIVSATHLIPKPGAIKKVTSSTFTSEYTYAYASPDFAFDFLFLAGQMTQHSLTRSYRPICLKFVWALEVHQMM